MSGLRPAAVSGLFYPSSAHELRSAVRRCLDEGEPSPSGFRAESRALIAPHAGYPYSGSIAGSSFRQLLGGGPPVERVVLLGPSHHFHLEGLALPSADAFETPLGKVPVAAGPCAALRELPQVTVDDRAHAPEHALEVELPFLQEALGDFEVVPMVVGAASAEQVAEVIERLWSGPETLVVVSSDLSHYHPYDAAARIDRETADRILEGRHDLSVDRACGAIPINGLLLAAERRGLAARLLDLRSSGDTAGDRQRVVGYGAFELGAPAS